MGNARDERGDESIGIHDMRDTIMVEDISWFVNPRTKMTIVRLGNPGWTIVHPTHPYRKHLSVKFVNDDCVFIMSETFGLGRAMKILGSMTCEIQ